MSKLPHDWERELRETARELLDRANNIRRKVDRYCSPAQNALGSVSYSLSHYDPTFLAWAEFEYAIRERRSDRGHSRWSQGPRWNIMLDLFIQECRGKRVTVTGACIASLAPPTTALRHIQILEEVKMVVRARHPDDARSSYLTLTDKGRTAMRQQMAALIAACPVRATDEEWSGEGWKSRNRATR